MNKNAHKKFLIAYFFLLLFLPYITMGFFYNVNKGYSLYNFIFLYFLGSYLNKYKIEKSIIFNSFSTKKIRMILLFLYLLTGIFNFLLYNFSFNLGNIDSRTAKYFASIIYDGFQAYNNPFTIFESIFLFSYFCLLDMKQSNLINYISKNVLGCYLISDNLFFGKYIYKFLKYNKNYYSFDIIPKTIFLSLILVVFFSIIESIRMKISKKMFNLKIFRNFKNIIINYINEFYKKN